MNKVHPALKSGPCLELAYLHGGIVHYRPGDRLAPRVLWDHELVLMLEGNAVYELDGKRHALAPGTAILARPGAREAYVWDRHGVTRHAYFHFGVRRIPADWPAPERWPVVRPAPDPVVGDLFRHVLARISAHPDWPAGTPARADCRVVEALIEAFLRPVTQGEGAISIRLPKAVHHALNLLRQTLEQDPLRPVNLSALARAAGVGEKHLCRLFSSTVGHPPLATYRLLKLQLAMSVLVRSDLAIKEVSARCGFDNPLYFSRCFTRVYGLSPSAARARMQQGHAPPPGPLPTELSPRLFW
ncbi:MAG TPA: AraC family transcriptional regulator [Kiritimatiellia bacterium]|nr:AraC family transcriptional regulator [Kiritimatiellia bacterium]